jgi:NAD(P)-dependent dehydrogenase (short-subunit alcohol dehydrogenase family)
MDDMRAALVTGGAVRLGAAIVERLARAGFSVAIHCNQSENAAQVLSARLRDEFGVESCVVLSDLAGSDLNPVIEQAQNGLGTPLRLLVNSASVFDRDQMEDFDAEDFDAQMAVNLRAPLLLSQKFAAQAPEGSAIINLLDQRVLRPTPQHFTYTLSKCALYTATRTMAQALAPKIRVNGVAPGLTLVNPHQDKADFDRRISTLPLRRGGSAEEVADVVAFLASCPSVTGQTIAVDGGQHLAWQTPDSIA